MKKAKKVARLFLLVIASDKNKVLEFWLGQDISNLKGGDLKRSDAVILKKTDELAKKYPHPRYEIILGMAPDVIAVKKAFSDVTGWDKVPVSSFKL